MQKRVFIIHGWDGHPEEKWFSWLKKELERRGFNVFVPQLLETEEPRINNWLPALKSIVGKVDINTYFIGHSMGCQAICRYLEGLKSGLKIGGAIFVAGFFKRLSNLEDDDVVKSVASEWIESPIDLVKVKDHLNKCVDVFSDNDHYVPLNNQEEYKNILGAKIIIEHNKGYFSGSSGVTSLPIALDSIIEMSQ